jgi:hypothetical protein
VNPGDLVLIEPARLLAQRWNPQYRTLRFAWYRLILLTAASREVEREIQSQLNELSDKIAAAWEDSNHNLLKQLRRERKAIEDEMQRWKRLHAPLACRSRDYEIMLHPARTAPEKPLELIEETVGIVDFKQKRAE